MRLITLTDKFYDLYGDCEEILHKRSRPYAYLGVKIDGVNFAIPFRHHIIHKHAFFTYGECGLDYTKAIVIWDEEFIDSSHVQIEQIEFNAIKGKEYRIQTGMRNYLALYRKAVKYRDNHHYDVIRECSSLQHFHKQLRIK